MIWIKTKIHFYQTNRLYGSIHICLSAIVSNFRICVDTPISIPPVYGQVNRFSMNVTCILQMIFNNVSANRTEVLFEFIYFMFRFDFNDKSIFFFFRVKLIYFRNYLGHPGLCCCCCCFFLL
jgi:hypothetical protein